MAAGQRCPGDDALAAFIERRIAQRPRGAPASSGADPIELHLDGCEGCRLLVANLAAVADVQRGAGASVPGSAVTEPAPAPRAAPQAPGEPAGFARGDRVARYVVERELGRGGMGVVFEAFDPALHRRVALKIVRPDTDSGEARARIMREARAMAQLAHPNVVTIHDVGELPDGRIFLAMELVDGTTLRRRLAADRSLAPTLDLFLQAARGLQAAHALGLVHRDFKPDNVLVGSDGRARVTDFGLVRAEDELLSTHAAAKGSPLTATGSLLGTPAYMAPEQHLGLPAGPQADQYAFAVALFEALTGVRPFAGRDHETLRDAKLVGERAPWPGTPALPPALRAAVDRALARDPDARHPRMTDLIAVLEQARHAPVAATVAPPPTQVAPVTQAAPLPTQLAPATLAAPVAMPSTPRASLEARPSTPTYRPSAPAPRRGLPDGAIYGIVILAVFVLAGVPLAIMTVRAWILTDGGTKDPTKAAEPATTKKAAEPAVDETPPVVPTFVAVATTPLACPSGTKEVSSGIGLTCMTEAGVIEGPFVVFHPHTKKIMSQMQYVHGKQDGQSWEIDESGRPKVLARYREGELEGARLTLHPSGRVRLEDVYRRGRRNGLSRVWSAEGRLESWSRWEDGSLVRQGSAKP